MKQLRVLLPDSLYKELEKHSTEGLSIEDLLVAAAKLLISYYEVAAVKEVSDEKIFVKNFIQGSDD